MTKPTITYGHGFLTDCDDDTNWGESEFGLACTLTVVDDDAFKLTGTCDNAANEYAYYTQDITNFSTDTYPKYKVRWKTSQGSNGLDAKIEFVFTAGSQIVTLGQSTSWTVTTGDLTAGKTVDQIRFWADDNPDTIDSGSYDVYYDFLLCYQGTFTFPYVSKGTELHIPRDIVRLKPPVRDSPIHQNFGVGAVEITLSGDMDTNTSWVASPTGRRLYQIIKKDPWQWFTSDLMNCKVVPVDLVIAKEADSNKQRIWKLILEQFSLSSGQSTLWTDLDWWGL